MRLSSTVSSRSSESSWGTSPIRARMRAPSVAGSIPRTRSVPPLRGLMHEIIRMVEVLPAPLGPRKPKDSPLAMVKSTPSTATKSPKRFTRPCASTMGALADAAPASSAEAASRVRSESGTSVIGEECDAIVRERYRAAQQPKQSGEGTRWPGRDRGGTSPTASPGAPRRPPTRLRGATPTTTGGPSSTCRARAAPIRQGMPATRGSAGRRTPIWWPVSASTTTGSRSSGAGSSRLTARSPVRPSSTTAASAWVSASAASTPSSRSTTSRRRAGWPRTEAGSPPPPWSASDASARSSPRRWGT